MSCFDGVVYPFTAIVGQEQMKKALVLNAINPAIGGVLIRGEKGTAKSTAVRALAELLPELEAVADCPFGCHPFDRTQMCAACRGRLERGETLPVVRRKMRVVELPLGTTEDRLLGTLDIGEAIRRGTNRFQPGILAEAHRAILYVDEVNLLPDHLVDVLLDAAAMGCNTVEREGISYTHPSQFILVGTMNPEEGDLRPQFLDRFGLCVEVAAVSDLKSRVEIIARRSEFERDPHGFRERWQKSQQRLAHRILRAKEMLPRVRVSREMLEFVARICVEAGVNGHRADIVMTKAATTIAAYRGRLRVTKEDVQEAAGLVLFHRLKSRPFQAPQQARVQVLHQILEPDKAGQAKDHPPPEEGQVSPDGSAPAGLGEPEVVFPVGQVFSPKSVTSRETRRPRGGNSRRGEKPGESRRGRYVRARPPTGKPQDVAVVPTLRAAACRCASSGQAGVPLLIQEEDIREKVREAPPNRTIVFVVDASGSMGARKRMIATKGAILSLLINAYQRRDRIALVAFRGSKAEVLLPPTSSVQMAEQHLRELPTGGKTPLAHGLLTGLELLKQELRRCKDVQPFLVLISDGRANIPLEQGDPVADARRIAEMIRSQGITGVVIDPENDFVNLGLARELAQAMGAQYYRLEDLRAEGLVEVLRTRLQSA